jgi:hypothetical protein
MPSDMWISLISIKVATLYFFATKIYFWILFQITFCSICFKIRGDVMTEQFDLETLKHIRNKLDYIYYIAKSNYNDNPELMDTIENLAQVSNMFTNIKIQELSKQVKTPSPQGYILSKLSNSYSRMKEYEKQKETDFPTWKL